MKTALTPDRFNSGQKCQFRAEAPMKTQNTDYITAWEAIRTKHVKLLADNAALKVALRTLVDAASERINEIGTAEELDALKAARAALEG